MKIRRNWINVTDTRSPADYVANWKPGATIHFDGTIDKSGQRHTDLHVEIDERDVISLHRALLKHYRESAKECVNERADLLKTIKELEGALKKISVLVSTKNARAPDTNSLLAAVEEIADHFAWEWNRDEKFKSSYRWLKWRSL